MKRSTSNNNTNNLSVSIYKRSISWGVKGIEEGRKGGTELLLSGNKDKGIIC